MIINIISNLKINMIIDIIKNLEINYNNNKKLNINYNLISYIL